MSDVVKKGVLDVKRRNLLVTVSRIHWVATCTTAGSSRELGGELEWGGRESCKHSKDTVYILLRGRVSWDGRRELETVNNQVSWLVRM